MRGTSNHEIHCVTDEAEPRDICVYTDESQEHILTFVSAGHQLNLIKPFCTGRIFKAELIIFEPDFLINISQIAQCFEPYGTDARIAVLKRLTPPANTEAINLGNFASAPRRRASRRYLGARLRRQRYNILPQQCPQPFVLRHKPRLPR